MSENGQANLISPRHLFCFDGEETPEAERRSFRACLYDLKADFDELSERITEEIKPEENQAWAKFWKAFFRAVADYVAEEYNVAISRGEAEALRDTVEERYHKKKADSNNAIYAVLRLRPSTASTPQDSTEKQSSVTP